jgi:hypothetical protein
MSFSPETVRDPEFSNGAQNRRLGMSKTQSSAHLKHHRASDSWLANRAGWDFMNAFLMMKEIDEEASKAESAR